MGRHTCRAVADSPSAPSCFPWGRSRSTHVDYLVPPLQKLICFIREDISQLELRAIV